MACSKGPLDGCLMTQSLNVPEGATTEVVIATRLQEHFLVVMKHCMAVHLIQKVAVTPCCLWLPIVSSRSV